MKNLKILSLVVIASMLLTVMPALAQPAMSLQLSAYSGYVGDTVTATGTIVTYNGEYELYFDSNKNGVREIGEKVAEGVATGYSFSKGFTVPNAYADADNVWVYDKLAGLPQAYQVWYTVITKYTLSASPSSNYEGGPITMTGTVTGGKLAWNGTVYLQLRILNPGASTADTWGSTPLSMGDIGYYSQSGNISGTGLTTWGTYTAYMDQSSDGSTWVSGVASTTFDIRLTTKLEYERTLKVEIKHWVPANTVLSKYSLTDPDGVETVIDIADVGPEDWTGVYLVLQTYKNSPLGIWTIKLYNETSGSYYKTATFKVIQSKIYVNYPSLSECELMRTETNTWTVHLYYADQNTPVTALDVPTGFAYRIYYNSTLAATLTSDPLTDNPWYDEHWLLKWKVPKDQAVGYGYSFNITTNAINDVFGNMGPGSNESSDYFEVDYAALEVSPVQLVYPLPGGQIQRTLTARASVLITYPDGSRYTAADFKYVNGTGDNHDDNVEYTFSAVAADYDDLVGVWVLKWKIPYNVMLGSYHIEVEHDQVEDMWGNSNYNDGGWAPVGHQFNVIVATITVTDLTTDSIIYNSDDVVTVSFVASYPSGDPVTTTNNTELNPMVYIYTSDNTLYKTKVAGYSSATGKWSAKWIIGEDAFDGTWTAEVKANAVIDDAIEDSEASNIGPTTAKTVTFDVTRISLTDVYKMLKQMNESLTICCNITHTTLAELQTSVDDAVTQATNAATQAAAAKTAADAAKASADSASSKADAAITAANEAKTAASAAKTAADAAGSKADAAKAAADAAKTAGDAAKDASSNLTTLVYGAIGASLVAAIAAIVALMQISRKIA